MTELWGGFTVAHAVTRSVRDSAALLDCSHGAEPGDAYAAPPVEGSYLQQVGVDPGRLRVGVVTGGVFHDDIDRECRAAVRSSADLLHELGHSVEGVELPVDRVAWKRAFLTVVAASVAAAMERSAGGRRLDPSQYELATWVLASVGRKLTAADYADAMIEVGRAGRVMATVMSKFDVVMMATQATPPLLHGALTPTEGERRLLEALRHAPAKPALMAVFRQLADKVLAPIPNTPLFNMTGQPAMSVPLHWTADGLPVGVQFAGRFGDEATLFRLAGQLEEAKPWFEKRPPGVSSS